MCQQKVNKNNNKSFFDRIEAISEVSRKEAMKVLPFTRQWHHKHRKPNSLPSRKTWELIRQAYRIPVLEFYEIIGRFTKINRNSD